MTTTWVSGEASRSPRSTVRPSVSGRRMSRMATGGRSSRIRPSPDQPVAALSTRKPRALSTLVSDLRMSSSSSMTTTVDFTLLLFRLLDRQREGDAEGGAARGVVASRDHAAVVAHDLERDGKPEAGPHGAGGEEGIEDLL